MATTTTYISDAVRLPSSDESVAPVTILDSEGQVLRVVSAAEFRRDHPRTSAHDVHRRRLRAARSDGAVEGRR